MAYTVEDDLRNIAKNQGWTYEEAADEQFSEMVGPSVPDRFRRLVLEVALRLPASWEYSPAMWRVEADWEQNPPNCYAFVDWNDERGLRYHEYVIKIRPSAMGRFSDAACRWILAQRFAYIALKLLPPLSKVNVRSEVGGYVGPMSDEQACAKITETIALWWGFERERTAYLDQSRAGAKNGTCLSLVRDFDRSETTDEEVNSDNKNSSRSIQ